MIHQLFDRRFLLLSSRGEKVTLPAEIKERFSSGAEDLNEGNYRPDRFRSDN